MQPKVLLPELLDQALPPGVIQQVLVGLEQSGEGKGQQPHAPYPAVQCPGEMGHMWRGTLTASSLLPELTSSNLELHGGLHLSQLALIIMTPGQAISDVPPGERLLHLPGRQEDLYVCKIFNSRNPGQLQDCGVNPCLK